MRDSGGPTVEVHKLYDREIRELTNQFLYTQSDQTSLDRIIHNSRDRLSSLAWVMMCGAYSNLRLSRNYDDRVYRKLRDYLDYIMESDFVICPSDIYELTSDVLEVDVTAAGIDATNRSKTDNYGRDQMRATDGFVALMEELYYYYKLDTLAKGREYFAIVLDRSGLLIVIARE